MTDRRDFLTLADRTKALLANSAIFYVAYVSATGHASPTGGLESVWLISGISLWLLSLLSAPWFVPPRDAVANGIVAASILITTDLTAVPAFRLELNTAPLDRHSLLDFCNRKCISRALSTRPKSTIRK
jgi:hypothetical protein